MRSKNNIIPLDITNPINKCETFSPRDVYKGTSFKMTGEWTENMNYFNDEYIIDWVVYEGALLSCVKSHLSSQSNKPELVYGDNDQIIGIQPNEYWVFVLAGIEGPQGSVWEPHYDPESGDLTWSLKNEPSDPGTMNIRGPKGDKGNPGKDGQTPIIGIKKWPTSEGGDNQYYWTLNNNWLLSEDQKKIRAQGLDGNQGIQGKPGEKGDPGVSPIFRLSGSSLQVSYNEGSSWVILGSVKGDKGDPGVGQKGDPGLTPLLRLYGDDLQVSYNNIHWKTLGRVTGAKGDQGDRGEKGEIGESGLTPFFKINENGWWEVSYDGKNWKPVGQATGPQGVPGRSPKFMVEWGDPDKSTDDRIIWGYDGVSISEWATLCYLSDLRGDSIQSVNIIDDSGALEVTMTSGKKIVSTGSVLPIFNTGTTETLDWDQSAVATINKTNAPREWALDVKIPRGKPATVTVVESVEKLPPESQPYVTDLNPSISDANLKFGIPQGEKGDPGDENVYIGCTEPTDKTQIWYDPCDEAMDEYSSDDFLYDAYLKTTEEAGIIPLSKLDFDKAFSSIGITLNNLQFKFLASIDDLPDLNTLSETEIRKLMGNIFLVPISESETQNSYAEYVIIEGPNFNQFRWEVFGTGSTTIDLVNYYTKSEVDQKIKQLEDRITQITAIWNQI